MYVCVYIYIYIYIVIYFICFVVHNLKILLLTIHHYFIYQANNIQYEQYRILNYTLVLIAAYFTHCSYSIPEALITAVPAPNDVCQHPKHVELPTVM